LDAGSAAIRSRAAALGALLDRQKMTDAVEKLIFAGRLENSSSLVKLSKFELGGQSLP